MAPEALRWAQLAKKPKCFSLQICFHQSRSKEDGGGQVVQRWSPVSTNAFFLLGNHRLICSVSQNGDKQFTPNSPDFCEFKIKSHDDFFDCLCQSTKIYTSLSNVPHGISENGLGNSLFERKSLILLSERFCWNLLIQCYVNAIK